MAPAHSKVSSAEAAANLEKKMKKDIKKAMTQAIGGTTAKQSIRINKTKLNNDQTIDFFTPKLS